MGRLKAKTDLRGLHPFLLEDSILNELIGNGTVEGRLELIRPLWGTGPIRSPEQCEMLRDVVMRAVERVLTALESGCLRGIDREDIADLLISEIPTVRLLAIRLSGQIV